MLFWICVALYVLSSLFYIAIAITMEVYDVVCGHRKFDISDTVFACFIAFLPIVGTIAMACTLLDRSRDKINNYITTKIRGFSGMKND